MKVGWEERINASAIWTFIRYFTIVIGFIRTLIVANILTTNEMGQLAFVYLILEYITLIVPLGSINSLNQQISNIKAKIPNLLYDDKESTIVYSASLWILLVTISIFLLIIFLINQFFVSILSDLIKDNFLIISLIVVLSVIKSFSIIHARLWEKYNSLIFSEIMHALIYLVGIYLFLDSFANINLLFLTLLLAICISILILRFNFIDIRFFKSLSLYQIKITLSIGIFLMINMVIETLFWGIDRFFIASVLEPSQLANFHIIHTYSRAVLMYFTAITFLFTPIIYTNYSKLKDDKNLLISNFREVLYFSEGILILTAIISTLVVPIIIGYLMPSYSNLENLYGIVIFGLVLKCLAFFPIAYIIATGLHKYLPIYSIILILILGISYYICYNFFELTNAINYSSVAIICFVIFLIIVSNHIFIYDNFINYLKKTFKVYNKIILCALISVFLFNQSYQFIIDNIYLNAIIISIIYINNFKLLFKKLLLLLSEGKESFINSFQN